MANNNANGRPRASIVIYRECHRNFALKGGHSLGDGCTGFLALGEDHTPEAYFCAACRCHRHFHRSEEIDVEVDPMATQVLHHLATTPPPPPYASAPPQLPVPENLVPEEDLGDGEVEEDEEETRRRAKTRFTRPQREAMRQYADLFEWSLQGHDEGHLAQFCVAIGITPEVFKAWMKTNRGKYHVDAGETSAVRGRGS